MELSPLYCDVIRRRWAEFKHGEGCNWEALTPVEGAAAPETDATSLENETADIETGEE